jgi:hypothetical protein
MTPPEEKGFTSYEFWAGLRECTANTVVLVVLSGPQSAYILVVQPSSDQSKDSTTHSERGSPVAAERTSITTRSGGCCCT